MTIVVNNHHIPNITSMKPYHQHRQMIEIAENRYANTPGKYRISKDKLKHHLTHGSYSMLTAANPQSSELSPKENSKRMADLETDLKGIGAVYHSATGVWDGKPEPSLMVHHKGDVTPKKLEELAQKHGQTAILHSTENQHTMKYVHGENAGLHEKGEGHQVDDNFQDDYTHIKRAGKFRNHIDFGKFHKAVKRGFHFVIPTEEGEVKITHYVNQGKYHK